MGAQGGGFTVRIEADDGSSFRRQRASRWNVNHQFSEAVLCREVRRLLRNSQEVRSVKSCPVKFWGFAIARFRRTIVYRSVILEYVEE